MKSTTVLEFDDPRYDAPAKNFLPWCQWINPRLSKAGMLPSGLAITLENAAAVNFTLDAPGWQQMEYPFSEEKVELLLTTTPRIVIVRRSRIGFKLREGGAIANITMQQYKEDRLKYKQFTKHLVFLVDENNQPLHTEPLQLTLSGSSGATFGIAYAEYSKGKLVGGFKHDLEKAYAAYRKQPHAPKGELFHAHGVFCPTLEVEEKGAAPNTAYVCCVTGYEQPTVGNLGSLMIGSQSDFSAKIVAAHEKYPDFGKPKEEARGEALATPEYDEYFGDGEPPY